MEVIAVAYTVFCEPEVQTDSDLEIAYSIIRWLFKHAREEPFCWTCDDGEKLLPQRRHCKHAIDLLLLTSVDQSGVD
jgi:hypothetical protein